MAYFYHWSAKHNKLFCHSGNFEVNGIGGETYFQTNDGSGKRYLHCGPNYTYSWNQIILDERNDIFAIEKLIEQAEKSITGQYKEQSTPSFENSLRMLKNLRDSILGIDTDTICRFCTTDTDEREMLIEYGIDLGTLGLEKVYTYLSDKNFMVTSSTIEADISCTDLNSKKIRIKYCPICGRKLGE